MKGVYPREDRCPPKWKLYLVSPTVETSAVTPPPNPEEKLVAETTSQSPPPTLSSIQLLGWHFRPRVALDPKHLPTLLLGDCLNLAPTASPRPGTPHTVHLLSSSAWSASSYGPCPHRPSHFCSYKSDLTDWSLCGFCPQIHLRHHLVSSAAGQRSHRGS